MCFRKPLTVIFPPLADCETVAVCPPSVAIAVNDVHGDALDDAEKVTSARSALTRLPETVTLKGVHAHRAYRVALAVNGYDAPSAYAVPFPFADVFHPLNV